RYTRGARALARQLDSLFAGDRREMREPRAELVRRSEEMRVFVLEHRDAKWRRRLQMHTRRRAHRRKQGLRHLQIADLAAFRFDKHGTCEIEHGKCGGELALETVL